MSDAEVVPGKAFIVNQLMALATQMGVTIDGITWQETDDGFDEGFILLIAEIAGKERRVRIEEEEIEDIVSTPEIQTAIYMKLRNLLYKKG